MEGVRLVNIYKATNTIGDKTVGFSCQDLSPPVLHMVDTFVLFKSEKGG